MDLYAQLLARVYDSQIKVSFDTVTIDLIISIVDDFCRNCCDLLLVSYLSAHGRLPTDADRSKQHTRFRSYYSTAAR